MHFIDKVLGVIITTKLWRKSLVTQCISISWLISLWAAFREMSASKSVLLKTNKKKWEGFTLRTAAAAKNNNVLFFQEHVSIALLQQMPKEVTEPPEAQWLIFFDSEHSWKNSCDPMRKKWQSEAECFPCSEWVAKKKKKLNEEQIEHW